MGISWIVLPLDLVESGFVEWLQGKGIVVSDRQGRYPTIDELITVLETIGDYPVSQGHVTENLWEISIGELYSSTYADLLGSIEDDGTFHFSFQKGSESATMLEILRKLAQNCGPLVLADSFTATPVLVTSNTIVDVALEEWHSRYNTNDD